MNDIGKDNNGSVGHNLNNKDHADPKTILLSTFSMFH